MMILATSRQHSCNMRTRFLSYPDRVPELSGQNWHACVDFCEKILDDLFDETVKKEKNNRGIVYRFSNGVAWVPYHYENGRDYEPGGHIYISYIRE